MSTTTKADPAPPVRLELAEKTHRPLEQIQADLDAARAEWARLEPVCRNQWTERQEAIATRADAHALHRSNPATALRPFNDKLWPVPEPGTPETAAFHRSHYRLATLEKEFREAQAALVGV